MSTMLERRVAELERHAGHSGADPFIEHLDADDAAFYTAIMRRLGRSGLAFEVFIRRLDKAELERLLEIHTAALDRLGLSVDDLLE